MRVVGAQRRLDSGQRDLLQTFLPRRLAQRVEILALAGEKLLRLVELDPAVRGSLVGAAILAVGQILRAGPARFDDVPAIGGGFGVVDDQRGGGALARSEEHTSELQSLMRISYAVFCLKKKKKYNYVSSHIR